MTTPDFKPISLGLQGEYLKRLAACPQKASDYSFINIWGWAEEYGLEWHFGESHVWIRQTKPDTVYWAPVGPWHEFDWSKCPSIGSLGPYIRVPEQLAIIWEKNLEGRITLTEERGHYDYLYSIEELTGLKGKKFHKKKNLLNQFKKKYDYNYHSMTPDCVEAAIAMQLNWFNWRDSESQKILAGENRAIMRVLQSWDSLTGVFGGVIEVGGQQAAYTVGEHLNNSTVVIHFEKGHINYKGIYQAINQMFLENDAAQYDTVNREQDLGDAGLRKAKESYNPIGYLKKFIVEVQ